VRRGAAGLALALAACVAPPAQSPTAVDRDDAVLWFDTGVPDASLWIDGRYVGNVGMLRGGVAIEPGVHRIEIRHDDYFSHYAELTLGAGERKRIAVQLAPVLP